MKTTAKHTDTANAFREAADLMRRQREVESRVGEAQHLPDVWEQRLGKALGETGQSMRQADSG